MMPITILSLAPTFLAPAALTSSAATKSRAYHSGSPAAPRAVSDACKKPRRERLPRFMLRVLERLGEATTAPYLSSAAGRLSCGEPASGPDFAATASNAAGLRVPDVLVHLELHADVQ